MPTPFSHLDIAHRLLHDPLVNTATRAVITRYPSEFLSGGIVADARVDDHGREYTHFYYYTEPMPDHPWLEMLRQHPALKQAATPQQRAFITGYVAHLAADEFWSRYMLKPHFAESDWGESRRDRFFWLHLLLIHMDERDEARLPDDIADRLCACTPDNWLPFMPDAVITEWQEFIAAQLTGESETLRIFGRRVNTPPEKLRALLDDDTIMQAFLWQHVPPALLHRIEADLYTFAREQMQIYIADYS